MKVLVTGSTGFLGRALMRRLALEHEVCGFARKPPADAEFPTMQGDVLDRAALDLALRGQEVLVHAAGLVSHEPADAQRCWEVHVRGTQHTLDAAAAAGVRRVIYISSSGTVAVSRDQVVLDEGAPSPLGIVQGWGYYRSKLFAEEEALRRNRPGFEVLSLNPSLLLGPGDRNQESTRSVILFLQGQLAAIPPGGLSFVDVRDAADAVVLALGAGSPGQRYLLGAANRSWVEFYAQLSDLTGIKGPSIRLPMATRKALSWVSSFGPFARSMPISRAELELACHFWYLDSGKARKELGWRTRDPAATLLDTVTGSA